MEEFINAIDTAMPEWKFGHYIKNKEFPPIIENDSNCPIGLLPIIAYFIQFDISQFTKDNLKQLIQLYYELVKWPSNVLRIPYAAQIHYCFMRISFSISDIYDFILMNEFDLNKAFIQICEDTVYLGDELSINDVCRALNINLHNAEVLVYIYLYKLLNYPMIKPAIIN
jgi:hypothetical protein